MLQPGVQNKNNVPGKEKINGNELFPENVATLYIWFYSTLEFDPDEPGKLRR